VDLAFLLDATGSMQGHIDGAKQSINGTAARIKYAKLAKFATFTKSSLTFRPWFVNRLIDNAFHVRIRHGILRI